MKYHRIICLSNKEATWTCRVEILPIDIYIALKSPPH